MADLAQRRRDSRPNDGDHGNLRDGSVADDLKFRPRQTIETFLGVKIPEVFGISVIVETPRNFGLVVPMATTT